MHKQKVNQLKKDKNQIFQIKERFNNWVKKLANIQNKILICSDKMNLIKEMIKNQIKLVYRIDRSVLEAKLEKPAKKVSSFK